MSAAEPLTSDPVWTLGERIRKARNVAGLEQTDIAAACGVARSTVAHWETGRSEPRASHLTQIARATGVSVGWLTAFPCFSTVEAGEGQMELALDSIRPALVMVGSANVAEVLA